eukprot:TRINITY_DN16201_c0_g1_i1.p1 TRINITY_DN16201_c0_g1~~TRINITY_DN16201_c0_g1_i1.p1  ORF type:complete len:531 (+),score=132.60 TRINITY_DN16201_c0_g1_i1:26-1594(+)
MQALHDAGEEVPLPLPPQQSVSGVPINRTSHALVCSGGAPGGSLTSSGAATEWETSASELSAGDRVHATVQERWEQGSACVLVLDAEDALMYQRFTAAAAVAYSAAAASHGSGAKELPAELLQEHMRGAVVALKGSPHPIPSFVSPADAYGAFHGVLSEAEADAVWVAGEGGTQARWPWMVERRLVAEPRQMVWGSVLYIPEEFNGRGNYTMFARELLQSVRLYGGRLNEALGIFVCAHPVDEAFQCDAINNITQRYGAKTVRMEYPVWRGTKLRQGHLMKALYFSLPEVAAARVGIFLDLDVLVLGDITRQVVSPRHLRMTPAGKGFKEIGGYGMGNDKQWKIHGFEGTPKELLMVPVGDRGGPKLWCANSGVITCPAHVCHEMGTDLAERAAVDIANHGSWHGKDQSLFAVTFYRLRPPFLMLPYGANLQPLAADYICKLNEEHLYVYHYKAMVNRDDKLPQMQSFKGTCGPQREFNALVPHFLGLTADHALERTIDELCFGAWHRCGTVRDQVLALAPQ